LKCAAESFPDAGMIQHVMFAPVRTEGRDASLLYNGISCICLRITLAANFYFRCWKKHMVRNFDSVYRDLEESRSQRPSIYSTEYGEALQLAKRIEDNENGMKTFVTGDDRLVGRALEIL